MYETILLESEGGVARLTLNRPEVLNAINRRMTEELCDAAAQINGDASIRAVVLRGAGNRAFCTGLDMKEDHFDVSPTAFRRMRMAPGVTNHHQAVDSIQLPVIAAIQGWAVGGGLELALACDIRVATADSRLGMMEVRRGLLGGAGGTQRLPRVVGLAKALELCLTGEPIDGVEAGRVGLVNRVAPPGELDAEVDRLVAALVQGAPLSLRYCKEAIRRGMEMPLAEGLRLESELVVHLLATEDRAEGIAAFREKRPPVWKGR